MNNEYKWEDFSEDNFPKITGSYLLMYDDGTVKHYLISYVFASDENFLNKEKGFYFDQNCGNEMELRKLGFRILKYMFLPNLNKENGLYV